MISGPAKNTAPITVFVHVHYPDIWQNMRALLAERLTVPFHLILTSSHPEREIGVPRTPALLTARFLPVENRGRDILPFLRAMAAAGGTDIGLKLHTKKSPQREDGALWRAELLSSLLPAAHGAERIIQCMRSDHRIGFVTPAGFCLSVGPWVLQNAAALQRILSALAPDFNDSDLDDAFFAAGSMFWFRLPALVALTKPELTVLFEPEEGQLDGTTAHAMERVFPVAVRRQGFVSLAIPALLSSRPSMPLPKLLELARSHADVPSRYFPAPYVPALPLIPKPEQSAAALGPAARLTALYRAILPEKLRLAVRHLMGRPLPAFRSG
jgi:lipopolysaccharide biosynthesis protein